MAQQSNFSVAKMLYKHHFITKEALKELVSRGLLTEEEYALITGESYQ